MQKMKFYLTVLVVALAVSIPLSFATWPTVAVTTTNLDADTDSPLAARPNLYDLATKFNQVRAHVSTFVATVLDDADAPAVRATIGISATNTPNTAAGNIAATNVQAAINELDTEKAGLALSNVFTGNQRISANAPRLIFEETDATATNKAWDVTLVGEQLRLRALSDDYSTAGSIIHVDRTANNIDSTSIYGDTISLTGTTINANGALAVDGLITASAGQIKFPATQLPSADVNTLDDYEEGTWTPSLGGTATYLGRSGTYTKIGRLVYVRGYIDVNTIGTGSAYYVSGLPFVVTHDAAAISEGWANIAASAVYVRGIFSTATSTVFFGGQSSATTDSQNGAVFTSSTVFSFSGVYHTN